MVNSDYIVRPVFAIQSPLFMWPILIFFYPLFVAIFSLNLFLAEAMSVFFLPVSVSTMDKLRSIWVSLPLKMLSFCVR